MSSEVEECEGNGLHVLDLPELAIQKILEYLDFFDYLRLRRVCLATKQWVETYEFQSNFENYPDDVNNISETFLLETPFRHSRVNITVDDWWLDDRIRSIFQMQGQYLKYLRLNSFSGVDLQMTLVSGHCNNLETLVIDTLHSLPGISLMKNEDEFDQFNEGVLSNLRHFKVNVVSINYPAGSELECFGKLLKHMPRLRTLNVPSLVERQGLKIEDKYFLSIAFGFIVGPVIKYISRRAFHDKCSRVKRVDLLNFEKRYFELFPELVRICFKCGTKLTNVDFALIRKLIAMRYDPVLLRTVQSVTNKINGTAKIFSHLYNVQRMSLDLVKCEFLSMSESQEEEFNLFRKLEELELNVWMDRFKELEYQHNMIANPDPSRLRNARKLLIEKSPNLKILILKCSTNCDAILLPITELISNTNNLTILKFKAFQKFHDHDFMTIIRNMKKLQVLEIEDEWGGISDLGICSQFANSNSLEIFTLSDLKKLKIKSRCKYSGAFYHNNSQTYVWPWTKIKKFSLSPNSSFISDYSFKEVFRHMSLISFLVESADIHISRIGYHWLVEGKFASTIEYFPHPEYLPTGLSSEEFYSLRKHFRHFQSSNIENPSMPSEVSDSDPQHCSMT